MTDRMDHIKLWSGLALCCQVCPRTWDHYGGSYTSRNLLLLALSDMEIGYE